MTNPEIVAAVERWQAAPGRRPLCCSVNCADRPLVSKEVDGRVVLTCPDCEYYTTFIPDEVLLWDGKLF